MPYWIKTIKNKEFVKIGVYSNFWALDRISAKYYGSKSVKKILHLFRTEKFTKGFVKLMESSKYNHTFWIFGERYLSDHVSYMKAANVKYYPRIEIKLHKNTTEKELLSFDLIVYHGLFEDNIIEYFIKRKILLKKIALYFWGGDKEKYINLSDKFQRNFLMKKYLIRNSAAVITILPQEYKELKKQYHPRGRHFCAGYFDETIAGIYEDIEGKWDKNGKTLCIQVGNSATKTNCHIDVLNLLKKFKDYNIELYLPLSYGDMKYAAQVISYGREIFGEKLKPITDLMPLKEYNSILGRMDIAIFAMTRQQALGNIYTLMINSCKVYLNSQGVLWDYFVNDMHCVVTAIDEINKMTFEQFSAYSEEEKQKNTEKIQWSYSRDKAIRQWEEVFEAF